MTYRSTALLVMANAVLIAAAVRPPRAPSAAADQPTPGGLAGWTRVGLDADSVADSLGTSQLQRIALTSNGLGLVVGSRSRSWRSTSAGSVWSAGTYPAFLASAAAPNTEGVAVLSAGDGRIFRSVDSSETWTMVRSYRPQRVVQDIEWVDSSTVFAAGGRQILVSHDAGESWEELDVPVRGYQALAINDGVIVTVGGGGVILRSIDGGHQWALQPGGTKALLRGVAFADATTVLAVGGTGTIVRSVDGGVTWQGVPSGTKQHLRAVAFDGTGRGFAVGFFGTILQSADRGATWQSMERGTNAHLLDVAFLPDGSPLIAGYFDTLLRGQPMSVIP